MCLLATSLIGFRVKQFKESLSERLAVGLLSHTPGPPAAVHASSRHESCQCCLNQTTQGGPKQIKKKRKMKSRIVFICPILQFPAWREIRPRMPLQEAPQVSSDVLVTIWSNYETDMSCGTNLNNSRFHFSFSLLFFAGSGTPFV